MPNLDMFVVGLAKSCQARTCLWCACGLFAQVYELACLGRDTAVAGVWDSCVGIERCAERIAATTGAYGGIGKIVCCNA